MKPLITAAQQVGLAIGALTLFGVGTANAGKVTNSTADVTVCDTLTSLTVMKEMPKGSSLLSDCRVLKKGTWWGVVLIDLTEGAAQAWQIAIPLTDGGTMQVWAPASQLYPIYDGEAPRIERRGRGY